VLVALAAAATVASVVRLGLEARRSEVEIMQLVGSPMAYIQGPFVAEGLLQGGLGALGALAVLGVGFALAERAWGGAVSAVLDGGAVTFLPAGTALLLLVGGMLVGALGGFAASRHAR
jgi:cell division protein FtsX